MSSITDFCNADWTPTELQETELVKSFPTVNVEILLYVNPEYDDYVSWLNNGAQNAVDENTAELTANVLSSFVTNIDSYDGSAIRIKVSHDTINA